MRVGKHLTMLTANSSRLSFGVAVMMPSYLPAAYPLPLVATGRFRKQS